MSPVGIVKWFDAKKGYGFISHDAGEDVFVHFSSIEAEGFRKLKHGDQVEFELVPTPKGLHAKKVRMLTAAPGGEVEASRAMAS